MINKYVGSRYVPLYLGIHDKTKEYEPLSIVSDGSLSKTYTSVQSTPKNIELSNTNYWVASGISGNFSVSSDHKSINSYTDSFINVEDKAGDYHLVLNASNSFDCGDSFDKSYTLNTMFETGRYIINPSKCTGIPNVIANYTNGYELTIFKFSNSGETNLKYQQRIVGKNSYIRTYTNSWSEWEELSSAFNAGDSLKTDLNNLSTSGVFWITPSSCQHVPDDIKTTGFGKLTNTLFDNGDIAQEIICASGGFLYHFERYNINGNWSTWSSNKSS